MPIINFQKQFADDVRSGKKTQTIRAPRKYPIEVGDTLYLYTGLRTKSTEKLGEKVCTRVQSFDIEKNGLQCRLGPYVLHYLYNLNKLAIADGFKDWKGMVQWFAVNHGLPFKGTLITWK